MEFLLNFLRRLAGIHPRQTSQEPDSEINLDRRSHRLFASHSSRRVRQGGADELVAGKKRSPIPPVWRARLNTRPGIYRPNGPTIILGGSLAVLSRRRRHALAPTAAAGTRKAVHAHCQFAAAKAFAWAIGPKRTSILSLYEVTLRHGPDSRS